MRSVGVKAYRRPHKRSEGSHFFSQKHINNSRVALATRAIKNDEQWNKRWLNLFKLEGILTDGNPPPSLLPTPHPFF